MDLNELRGQIDSLDDELLRIFLKRMKIVEQVALYKMENALPVLHGAREKEILARIARESPPDTAPYAQELFQALMRISRDFQQSLLEKNKQAGHKGG